MITGSGRVSFQILSKIHKVSTCLKLRSVGLLSEEREELEEREERERLHVSPSKSAASVIHEACKSCETCPSYRLQL